ncbi:MAG: B12-binding domain-containing radical SAM protein [Proteobacteria bacterium]|nr:B12-binding domain-containing radical SAM protein [Pseudomonadota bacterium]
MSGKVVLATAPTVSQRTAEETLALEYLAAVLRRARYEVVIVDAWLRGIGCREAVNLMYKNGNPSVICVSCYRSNLDQASDMLRDVMGRSKNVHALCGGYGPTFHDVEFLKAGFDIAVRGEAEPIIADLIRAVLSGGRLADISGISFLQDGEVFRTKRTNPVTELDSIPFPERDEMPYVAGRKNPVHICTSRGCNGNCTFCSVAAFNRGIPGRRWRGRTIGNIVEEIRSIHERYGATHFKFVDDSFIEPPRDEKWMRDFADAIRRAGLDIRFRTQVRADRLTEPIVRELKSCGWFATNVGVENFSNSALSRMGKPARVDDNVRAIELLRKHDVYAQIGLIMFDDSTTMRELVENCQALCRHSWVVIKGVFTEMFAAEGTTFTSRLESADLLSGGNANQNYSYQVQDPLARRVHMMLKSWHKAHALLYDQVIDPITAPKVMSDAGYKEVHRLCTELLELDTRFFVKAISQVANVASSDEAFAELEIRSTAGTYAGIRERIDSIYGKEGLVYDGKFNPFLV